LFQSIKGKPANLLQNLKGIEIWNEKLEFKGIRMNYDEIETWPIFQVSVYDYNKFSSKVPMGYNYYPKNKSNYMNAIYKFILNLGGTFHEFQKEKIDRSRYAFCISVRR